jgi:hypothetical protein
MSNHNDGDGDRRRRQPDAGEPGDDRGLQARRVEPDDEAEEDPNILEARRLYRAAPRYRVQFEADGTVSLCEKRYRHRPERPAAAATCWPVRSRHPDLDDAERRLRHISTPPIYYDERGRPVLVPPPAPPAWGEDEADLERGPPPPPSDDDRWR